MFIKVKNKRIFSALAYKIVKHMVQLWIPGLASIYFLFDQVFSLPDPETVIGALAILALFLGMTLVVSTKNYYKTGAAYDGNFLVVEKEGRKLISLELNGDPEELPTKDVVTFKISNTSSEDEE